MRVQFLDLKAIHEPLKPEFERLFKKVMEESYFVYGKQVSEFEQAFAQKLGVNFCHSVGNCTDALFITLKMMGIGNGDEVLVPAMTWITDAEVVSNLGATPVFVDIDPDTYNIDPSKIEEKITLKTKAIIAVHLYGQMADMDLIMSIAKSKGLKVIEDCAQAHFASHNARYAGTFGDAAVFSFYPTKNLGALGDAGCIITNDKNLYEASRKYANHGAADKHTHEFPGGNSRMDTLQAAVLNLKLQFIDEWNATRRQLAEVYDSAFSNLNSVEIPFTSNGSESVYHVYQVLVERRDELKKYLHEKGIQTQIHYPKALPFTMAYEHFNHIPEDFPIAFDLQNKGLSLPLFPGIGAEQQEYVIAQVHGFYDEE